MEIQNLSRQQLYDLVWSIPRSQLKETFSISDVAIAKRCKKLGVPMPKPGYWARVSAGQTPPKDPLPSQYEAPKRKKVRLPQSEDEVKKFVPTRETYRGLKLHPMLAATKSAFKDKRYTDTYGCLHIGGPGLFSSYVSKYQSHRALWLWSQLLERLEAAGLSITLSDSTKVGDGNETVIIALNEKSTKVKAKRSLYRTPRLGDYEATEWIPNGHLSFACDHVYLDGIQHEWKDKPSLCLDDMLDIVVVGLQTILAAERERTLRRREELRRADEHRKLQEEILAAKKLEKARRKKLQRVAESLRSSRDIFELIDSVTRTRDPILNSEQGQKWTDWARSVANDLNPVNSVLDALYNEVDPAEPSKEDYEQENPRPSW